MRLLAVVLGICAVGVWLALFYGDFWNGFDLGEPLGPEREDSLAGVGLGLLLIGCVLGAMKAWGHGTHEVLVCPECGQEFPADAEYEAHHRAFHSASG